MLTFGVSELRSKNIEIYYSVGMKDSGSQTRDIQAIPKTVNT